MPIPVTKSTNNFVSLMLDALSIAPTVFPIHVKEPSDVTSEDPGTYHSAKGCSAVLGPVAAVTVNLFVLPPEAQPHSSSGMIDRLLNFATAYCLKAVSLWGL